MTKESGEHKSGRDDKAKARLIYRFSDVSRLTGLDQSTLEAWEEEFPFLNAGRTGSGQKFFRQKDVDIVLRIKELLASKKLTQAGIRRYIEEEFGLIPATPIHPEKLRKTLYNVRDELRQIATSLDKKRKKA